MNSEKLPFQTEQVIPKILKLKWLGDKAVWKDSIKA